MVIKLHSARLSFLRVLVPHRLRTRCALVPLVPRTPYDPMSLVPCALRALVFHCLTCSRASSGSCLKWYPALSALVPHLARVLRVFVTYVPRAFYMLMCPTFPVPHMLLCLT